MVALAFWLTGCAHRDHKDQHNTTNATGTVSLARYQCQSGAHIQASYPTDDTAIIRYQGTTYRMHIAVSASGARYAGDTLEWWTKGTDPGAAATLFTHTSDGTGDTIERCRQARPGG